MNTYTLTLESDNGKHKIKTVATSFEAAKIIIMKAENCPESAISPYFKENEIFGFNYLYEGKQGTVYARKMRDLKNPLINKFHPTK